MGCEAHAMLVDEVNRVKHDVGELYSLDRDQAKIMAQMGEKIATMETEQKHMRTDIANIQSEVKDVNNKIIKVDTKVEKVENKVDKLDTKVETMASDVASINQKVEKIVKRQSLTWSSKEKALVVVALLSFAGTIFSAILIYLK